MDNIDKLIRVGQEQLDGQTIKRFKFIVCKVLQREAYHCAARSPHIVDVVLMPQGLHDEPDKLRAEVQKQIDDTTDIHMRDYDAILLGYGLCSNGILGLSATVPLVAPRGHDCMTLLLGSKEQYRDYFDSHRGIYWYSPGWIECNLQPGKERYENILQFYKEKYGDDNAEYLMEMEQRWMKEYSWATYVEWGLVDDEKYKQYTKQCAEFLGWNYDSIPGDPSLMQRMVDGIWSEEEFLVLRPGDKIAEDLTQPGIIKSD